MSDPPVALLCTSNGVGLGHVTRVMAVARQMGPRVRPVIFTLSAAVGVPVNAGFEVEHLVSAGSAGLRNAAWHELLDLRLRHLVDLYRPGVVAFDGVHPYLGLVSALTWARRRRGVATVWQRRAMWRQGIGAASIEAGRSIPLVIEPGDYAEPYDGGATTQDRSRTRVVRPITFVEEPLDRADACADLGLDPCDTNILVQLGAGAINDVASVTGAVIDGLRRHDPRLSIVVARSQLSTDHPAPGVRFVQRFPISRWFAAFDGAVLAAGYNSFHEALGLGLPTLFVPNLATRTDDQCARSRFASDHGLGLEWREDQPAALGPALARLVDPEARAAMRTAMASLPRPDGAAQVADLLTELAR